MNINKNILFITFTQAEWHSIFRLSTDKYNYIWNILYLNKMENISKKNIINYVRNSKAKCIVFDLQFSTLLDQNFLARMKKKLNLKYIFTFGDDGTQRKNNMKFMPICDLALVSSTTSLNYYKNNGFNAAFFLFEANLYKNEAPKLPNYNGSELKIVFYGNLEKGRKEYLLKLKNAGLNIVILPYIKDSIILRQEILKYDVIINFSKSQNRIPNRFFNTLLYKKLLKKIIKHPEKELNFNEFKGRIFESILLKRLCISEYFDEYGAFFPKNEMPFFNSTEDFLKLINDLSTKKEYKLALSRFLSTMEDDSNSILLDFFNNFEDTFRKVYELERGAHGKVDSDKLASIYSFMDKFMIRFFFILKKIF